MMLNDSQSKQEPSSLNEGKSPHIKIEIEDHDGNKAVYSAHSPEINIGRAQENHIRLTQRNISREHVKLYVQPDGESVIAQDLDSYLGVYLNGRKINEKCQLRIGEYLNIGDYMISLKKETPENAKAKAEVEYLPFEAQSKLVAVSSNLAGKSFPLDRKEMMIGRIEEENDLVINHRSISRNHAKVIYRDGEFILLDMGSSNGITLNHESNVKSATLKNGDLLVMGMVKLRFVAPGDPYVFNVKDIDDQNLDKSQSHKDVMFIVMLLLTALISAWLVSKYLVRQKNAEPINQIEKTMPQPELVPAPALELDKKDSMSDTVNGSSVGQIDLGIEKAVEPENKAMMPADTNQEEDGTQEDSTQEDSTQEDSTQEEASSETAKEADSKQDKSSKKKRKNKPSTEN
jgi:pSer/pThr/pTyr-binding forkhead associated (FHA) protein